MGCQSGQILPVLRAARVAVKGVSPGCSEGGRIAEGSVA